MGKIVAKANATMRPGAYNPIDFGAITRDPREIRFSYNRAARITFIDEVHKKQKVLPSPHNYSPEKAHRIEGTIKL